MKSLRFRIVVTWLCFAFIGASLLFGFNNPFLVAICCLLISSARHFASPAFPRAPRLFERIFYLLLLPMIFFFLIGFWFEFAEPWARMGRVALWICLPILLSITAFQDLKTWNRSVEYSGRADNSA
jgi:hypothetical protein